MSWGDVRGLLQYVPQFRGKVFVVVIDSPEVALAETMLDLVALQNIGVRIVLGSTVHPLDDLLDRAAEVELNVEYLNELSKESPILEVLERGQALVSDFSSGAPFAEPITRFAGITSAAKIIYLHGVGESFPRGAILASDIQQDQPKLLVEAALICQQGVPRVHILNGADPGVLLDELFSNEGVGTMIYADSYRTIRPLREEDIVELLGMIGRSIRNSHLVPRNYTDVVNRLSDYSVMEIDGNVVGSVALYHYEGANTAEIACLYVKQAHEGLGYGIELVQYAEQQAREAGLNSVFALTNRAAEFFQRQLGYELWAFDDIPKVRREQLVASRRDSQVLGKKF